jgi:hypothetical protein
LKIEKKYKTLKYTKVEWEGRREGGEESALIV